jgi:aerobic carbon-monoxide dehydrogenase medium subunit
MKLPQFDYLEPTSLGEACALLDEDPEGSSVIAGGTDVLVNLRERLTHYRRLVSLARIGDLRRVEHDPGRGLSIGAMATVNAVARHEDVGRHYPGIVDACHCLAADQVRNLATVVGNLCMAVPSADMAPIMLAWDAALLVCSSSGERRVRVRELFVGPRETVLGPGEIVTALEVPPWRPGQGDCNLRQGGRASLSLPIASAAAVVEMDGEVCRSAAIALGAVGPTPVLAAGASAHLEGKRLTEEALLQAGELAASASQPIDDLRSPRAYRLELVKVLARRAVMGAAARSGEVR